MSSLQHAAVENHRLIRRARRPILERRAMTASKEDIAALRGILNWCTSNKGPAGAATRERMLNDGLRKAIALLSEPDARDRTIGWVLAALNDAVRKSPAGNGMYYVIDRDLYAWAMDQIQILTAPADVTPEGNGRQ